MLRKKLYCWHRGVVWECKRWYQRLTYNLFLDLALYNDGQRGVFKYSIILQSSTNLLNTLTPFPEDITQCSLPRFHLFSTPSGQSSTYLLAPITACPAMGISPLFLESSTARSCRCWNPGSAGDLQQLLSVSDQLQGLGSLKVILRFSHRF